MMHPNQSRPHPLPPLHASAWGTASAVLDPKGYFNTLDEVFSWADRNATLHTVHVEETLPEWPYRCGGVVFRKRDGGWVAATDAGPVSGEAA